MPRLLDTDYTTNKEKRKQKKPTFITPFKDAKDVMLIVFNTPYTIIFRVKFAVFVYFYLLCKP